MTQVKIIDLYLSGGGVKCSYQIALIKYLLSEKKFIDNYTIRNIYSVSFGSFIGHAIMNGTINELEKIFLNLKSQDDILKKNFDFWGMRKYFMKIPLFGKYLCSMSDMIWLINGILGKGFYMFDIGYEILNKLQLSNVSKNSNISDNKKFYCYVYNVTKNKLECINSQHPFFQKYIIASCSYWGLFKPVLIKQLKSECNCNNDCTSDCKNQHNESNNFCDPSKNECECLKHQYNEYIDGGIEQIHPFVNLRHSEDDIDNNNIIHLLLATDDLTQENPREFTTGNNIIEYLVNIINYNLDKKSFSLAQKWHNKNHIIINYSPPVDVPNDINKEKIKQMFEDGKNIGIELLNKLNLDSQVGNLA